MREFIYMEYLVYVFINSHTRLEWICTQSILIYTQPKSQRTPCWKQPYFVCAARVWYLSFNQKLKKKLPTTKKNASGFRYNSIVGKVLFFLVTRDWTGHLCLTWWTNAFAYKLLNNSKTVVLHVRWKCLYLMTNRWFLKTFSRLVHGSMIEKEILDFFPFLDFCLFTMIYFCMLMIS